MIREVMNICTSKLHIREHMSVWIPIRYHRKVLIDFTVLSQSCTHEIRFTACDTA